MDDLTGSPLCRALSSLQPLGTNLNRQEAPLPRGPGAGPCLSESEMPLWKVSGHQYFMPLELSLFLCQSLRLPDGQGLATSSITKLFPPRRLAHCQGPAGWPQLWPTHSAQRATALSWTLRDAEEARGTADALRGSQMEGPQ